MASRWQGLPLVVSVDPHFVCRPMCSPSGRQALPGAAGPRPQSSCATGAERTASGVCDWFRPVDGWFQADPD